MKLTSAIRLGNLFRETYSGKIVECIGIKTLKDGFKSLEVSGNFPSIWKLSAISLTPEVAVKLGFEEVSPYVFELEIYSNAYFRFSLKGNNPEFPDNSHLKLIKNGIAVATWLNVTVDELQNIYIIFKGKELDVSALSPEPTP